MCGLYGFKTREGAGLTSDQIKQRSAITRALALIMQSRGTDSAGIASVSGNEVITHKKAVPSGQFILNPDTNTLIDRSETLIGHTRLATHGAVTDENAHPFTIGNIVGAHNGMIFNHADLNPNAQVDSMVVFEQLNKYPDNIKEALKTIYGQAALTWLDQRDTKKLHVTASENPLIWGEAPGLNTMFWASTQVALEQAMAVVLGSFSSQFWKPADDCVHTFNADLTYTTINAPLMAYDDYLRTVAPEYSTKKMSKKERKRLKKRLAAFNAGQMRDDEPDTYEHIIYNRADGSRRNGLEYCDWCGANILTDYDGFYVCNRLEENVCIQCGQEEKTQGWGLTYVPPTADI